ncbi:MAG: hypothetical protein ACK4PH_06285, partial [Aquincola tertiaricarbonis]
MSVDTLLDNVAHPVPPPGLPDAATLARLAGEFFAALPGGAPSLPASLPTSAPALPTTLPAAPALGSV